MSRKSTTDTDQIVGRNIRIYRLAKGLTQSALGEKLGITFQQIQKCEKGTNRVGSGRLFQIAGILGVSVMALFEGAVESHRGGEPSPMALLAEPLGLRLAQAFSGITDKQTCHALVVLVELMRRQAAK